MLGEVVLEGISWLDHFCVFRRFYAAATALHSFHDARN
jgi:hypothetical protein